jgi:TRAP-type C4-dicarboxylate transport system permease small subunit
LLAKRLMRGAEVIAALLFAIMFGAFMIQIVSRYVFNHPVQWSLELCSLSYIWLVFWSSDLIVRERQHIVFDLIYKKFRPPVRRWVAVSNTGAMVLVFLIGLPASLDYIQFMGRRSTLILHIPLNIAYACFGIFMIAVIVGGAIRLKRLFGASWRQEL